MTTGAWIMIVLTWSVVGSAAIWLIYKVLTTPPRNDDKHGD
nr:hypothetical protein [Nannocystis sp.]